MKIEISQEGVRFLRSQMKPGETDEDFLQRLFSERYEMTFALMKVTNFTVNLLKELTVLNERGILPDESEVPNFIEMLKVLRGQEFIPDEPESQNILKELYAEIGEDVTFNLETLPGWAIAWIDDKKIPLSFKKGSLTQEQEKEVAFFVEVASMWMGGFIEVKYEEGEGIKMYLTKSGKELRKNLEEAEV